jgi:hypothetical protein
LFVPLKLGEQAEVAELVDARDLKSRVQQWTYGFDSRLRHHILLFFTIIPSPVDFAAIKNQTK